MYGGCRLVCKHWRSSSENVERAWQKKQMFTFKVKDTFFILKGNIFYFGFVVKIFVFRYSTEWMESANYYIKYIIYKYYLVKWCHRWVLDPICRTQDKAGLYKSTVVRSKHKQIHIRGNGRLETPGNRAEQNLMNETRGSKLDITEMIWETIKVEQEM